MLQHFSAQLPVGVRFILLSALGFAMMSACVKYVSSYGIPVFEIIAARAFISLLISYVDIKRKGLSVWGNNKPLLLLRGTIGTIALMCVYYSFTTLPLAEATILRYVHPVFTALLGVVFLKECIRCSTMVCIALCLTGLMVIVQPGINSVTSQQLPSLSVLASLFGAFGSSIAYVIVRKLTQTEDSSVIIFYFPLVALPISVVLIWNSFIWPDFYLMLLLIFVGVSTQIGQYGLTKAMQTQTAVEASAYSYIQIIFSVLLGVWLFSELPSVWTYLGGGLIVTGAMIHLLGQKKLF